MTGHQTTRYRGLELLLVAVDTSVLVAALAEAALTHGSANKATANAAGKINLFVSSFLSSFGCHFYNFTTFTLLMSGSF